MSAGLQLPPILQRDDFEPSIAAMLDRKAAATAQVGAYRPVGEVAVRDGLTEFLARTEPTAQVTDVVRMGGGASKEQYIVEVVTDTSLPTRYVLRLDALQSVMETDRQREFDVLKLVSPHLPVPEPMWVDPAGSALGRPFLITSFVTGVAKPTQGDNDSVSGLQTDLSDDLRGALSRQFVANLAALHSIPLAGADLGSLGYPGADPLQPARWQVNWWTRVWADDAVVSFPLIAVIEQWLRENAPAAADPVVVHGDYRTGNYLFDESDRRITSILDWELAHIGDHHEDLGWAVQRMYSTAGPDGSRLITGLMPREDFLEAYQEASGRAVDPDSLRYYEVLCAFKSLVATLASSVRAARDQHSHQDVLLSWLASCGYVFAEDICGLMER
ncbi:hypothetical protein ACN94_18345 [Gordonia paraffinivorans]|uniref:phosphotransferase family protein n=1 Tax=Gordonia paraffinivorans TaxID=175628 RepID=UPI001C930179|nr:phosphotransferase family protein [Gordonia paraffinivorans]MBY4575521.1 hypothetical protein [Gordonia paraffinivorans]